MTSFTFQDLKLVSLIVQDLKMASQIVQDQKMAFMIVQGLKMASLIVQDQKMISLIVPCLKMTYLIFQGQEWHLSQRSEGRLSPFTVLYVLYYTISQDRKRNSYTLPSEWNKLEDSRFQYNRITFQIEIKNKLLEQLNEE